MNNNIQQQTRNDLKNIKDNCKILVKTDKASNLYKTNPNNYKQMLYKEVIKLYKKDPFSLEDDLNKEAELLA